MTRKTAYDQFVSNELDPISCLEPVGINDSNKFNVLKLAGVLASFGDFKDTKYRLKIRKEQSVMIQAVRYLLEKSASESTLGKRQLSESASDLIDAKKQKTHDGAPAKLRPLDGSNEAPEAAKHKPACTFSTIVRQEIPVREAVVEAARALQDMAKKNPTEDSFLSTRNAYRWNTSDVPKSSNLLSRNISASRTYLSKVAPQMLSNARFELATNWHLDTELRGTRLKDVVVAIRGTDLPPAQWWYGAYEGKSARVMFVSSAANEPLVSVKLLEVQPLSKIDGSTCTDSEPELREEVELKIPGQFLAPLLPEKCGDDVVVLRAHGEQHSSKIKGTRWQVRAFVTGWNEEDNFIDDEDKGEGEGEVLDLIDIESEAGHLRLPRSCLAKCLSLDY